MLAWSWAAYFFPTGGWLSLRHCPMSIHLTPIWLVSSATALYPRHEDWRDRSRSVSSIVPASSVKWPACAKNLRRKVSVLRSMLWTRILIRYARCGCAENVSRSSLLDTGQCVKVTLRHHCSWWSQMKMDGRIHRLPRHSQGHNHRISRSAPNDLHFHCTVARWDFMRFLVY